MGEGLLAETGYLKAAFGVQLGLALSLVQFKIGLETLDGLVVIPVVQLQFAQIYPSRSKEIPFALNHSAVVAFGLVAVVARRFAVLFHRNEVDVRHQVGQHQVCLQKGVVLLQGLFQAVHRGVVLALIERFHRPLVQLDGLLVRGRIILSLRRHRQRQEQ